VLLINSFKETSLKENMSFNKSDNILKYLKENGYTEKEEDIDEIFSNCIMKNEYNELKLILKYAYKNNIILKINEKNKCGNNPFISCIQNNNIKVTKLIIDYAIKNNIIIDINEKSNNGNYPLSIIINKNNIDMIKLIVGYAYENDVILIIRESEIQEASKINLNIKKILINYLITINKKFQKILKDNGYNITNSDINKYFLNCIYLSKNELVKLIMVYANNNNIILQVNEVSKNNYYPLLWCTMNNNFEMTQLIIDYAYSKNIILRLDF